MFELNFFAPLDLAQRAIAAMRAQGTPGAIVNVSSIAGRMALPWFTLYSASKFALCALSSGLRMELAGSGIRVMSVLPGYVTTGFQDHVLGGAPPPAIRDMKRFAVTAEECAAAMVRGIESDARTVVTPGAGRLLTAFATLLPFVLESRLVAMNRRLERGA
jgi:short-subunit dehydrogenase